MRALLCVLLPWLVLPAAAVERVQLTFDASEAEQVLAILDLRAANAPVTDAHWLSLFATEPYRRLKVREAMIGEQFKTASRAFTDEDFKRFVMSDALLADRARLRETLARWTGGDLKEAAANPLRYLPANTVIRAKVYPIIKPGHNSCVWDMTTDPTIFLFLDPTVGAAKFTNTVAHELHHIGLAAASADDDRRIAALPERARSAAEWIGAFGEGLAMLAAAGSPDVDPHAASSPADRERWNRDLANADRDLETLDAFFTDILGGRLTGDAIAAKGSSFFGVQGPWYTVGYRMAVIVEKRFGRDAVIAAAVDPRQLLLLYNRAAKEHNAAGKDHWPLWSETLLTQ